MNQDHPTHAYIGRKPECGCVDAIVSDWRNERTGRMVSELIISAGLDLERITWQDYVDRICKEPGYMRCPCPHEEAPDSERNQ